MSKTEEILKDASNRLREALEATPEFQAWKAAQKSLEDYQKAAGSFVELATIKPWLTVITENSLRIIEEAGRPVSTDYILAHLQKIGVPFPGQKPKKNLCSGLSRQPEFRSVKDGGAQGWWFSDRPYPGEKPKPQKNSAPLAVDANGAANGSGTGHNTSDPASVHKHLLS